MVLTDELGRRHIAPPLRFRDEPPQPRLREPLHGEHTAALRAALDAGGRKRAHTAAGDA
jgi:crotonobetainyl-CoA:carnitine CoA-transferase CaiB-like acyl-CoA transferase